MTLLDAIIAGTVQGLAEFLPISSSGHLVVLQYFVPIHNLNDNLQYTTLLHGATLLAVIAAMWNDIVRIVRDAVEDKGSGRMLVIALMVATIPGALVGLLFAKEIERVFVHEGIQRGGMPFLEPYKFVGVGFILTAQLFLHRANLTLQKRSETGAKGWGESGMNLQHALMIGLAQAVAVVPGISRSGATIATGVIIGFSRQYAARFSFLMSIPLIAGAVAHTTLLGSSGRAFWIDMSYRSHEELVARATGLVVAAISGFIAVKGMLRLLQTQSFHKFVLYLWIIGLLCIAS